MVERIGELQDGLSRPKDKRSLQFIHYGNRSPHALLFGYPTSIHATPAVESPPELHGTVAQDRLSDRPGRGDG